jgi:glycerophosphoryl diester phosphodiesterase
VTSGNPDGSQLTATAENQEVDTASIIAHRGFAGIYPENTVAAVRGSVADGRAETVEIDVVPTADDKIVVFHDDDLSRVTNAPTSVSETKIWELSYEQIAGYSILGTNQSVPLLTDVLAAIPPEFTVNIELKNPGCEKLRFAEALGESALTAATDRWRSFVGRVLDVLDVSDKSDDELLVSSFYEGALAATRTLRPSVPIASVFYDSVDTGLELSHRYDVEAIHPPWNMVTGSGLSTAETPVSGSFSDVDLVRIARREGWLVNAWTVQTWHQAAELQRAGVDGIITDYPGVCTAHRPQPEKTVST